MRTLPSDDGHVVSLLVFSSDGRRLAVGMNTIQGAREDSYDGSIELWDARTARKLLTLPNGLGALSSIAFSPGGELLATGEYQERGRTGLEMQENIPTGANRGVVRLWKAGTGKSVATLLKHLEGWPYVAFSHQNSMLAVGLPNGTMQLWSTHGSKLRATLSHRGSPIHSLAYSPSGGVLAAGRENGTLWLQRLGQR